MPQQRSHRRTNSTKFTWQGAVGLLLLVIAYAVVSSFQGDNNSNSNPHGAATQAAQPTVVAAASTKAPANPASPAGDSVSVWFSDPLAKATTGGPENNLIETINSAKKTIDLAIYNLTLDNVSSALIQAKKRGVKVRIAMESEAMDKDVPQQIKSAGIPIVGDQREGLMHDKFMIVDSREVWMGSMNYTSTSAYKDFNNLVRIRSAKVVQNYQAEFDQMFAKHLFGPDKAQVAPYHQVTVGSTPLEVYFSPADGISEHVVAELQKAQKSITFMAYSFTSNDFATAIKARAKAGVKVRGVFDDSQNKSNVGGEYTAFKRAGYDVRIDGIPGLLHDKVFIIDNQVVITGSYNFSANAENTNDENLVILRDPALAAQYLQHFEQIYGSAQE